MSVNAVEIPAPQPSIDVREEKLINESLQQQEEWPRLNRFLRVADEYWLLEWLGVFLAFGSIAGIAALLGWRNGRPSPNWHWTIGRGHHTKEVSITINTIISLFSTAFKSGLLIPVSASLGQLKWIWFQGGRPLSHFAAFDSAARGPLGSVVLLWTLRGRRLACLGALIIIASLAVDFALQALVIYPLRPVDIGIRATVPRANNYGPLLQPGDGLEPSMYGAIFAGVYNWKANYQVQPSCATGNCTFPDTYTSLAVCSSCYDVTNELRKSCATGNFTHTVCFEEDEQCDDVPTLVEHTYCNYTLPNGLEMSGLPSGNWSYAEISGNLDKSVKFDLQGILSVFSTIHATRESRSSDAVISPGSVQATECGLYYCVQKHTVKIVNGSITEKLVDTYLANPTDYDENPGETVVFRPPQSWTNVSDGASFDPYENTPNANIYMGGGLTDIRETFRDIWNGSRRVINGNLVPSTTALADMTWTFELDDFSNWTHGIASSMNLNIRTNEAVWYTNPFPTANGTTYQDQPFVSIRWPWIALPAVLAVLALILLLSTIHLSAKKGALPWKGNSLAHFFHPLTSGGRHAIAEAQTPRQMQSMAERFPVRVQKTESGFRLVEHGIPIEMLHPPNPYTPQTPSSRESQQMFGTVSDMRNRKGVSSP
ncbi:hypothetical protein G647_09680 [Cladophialophora carrionii CBS 160.54]|uniref:Uncharacterized protein n=1 Tax=Cladophialophora carrionii CBS 160.54 TaxID=1279043 RepID=V9DKR7_9EURO|nr:uncharacterized protein G647_09680 [Cladophialophora carrionii CBS 160.54]ETI27489.1 hypothetical protein G647_09680 [Cladophialophora carrionii CBS 160.54]